jgi:hypothetical protein
VTTPASAARLAHVEVPGPAGALEALLQECGDRTPPPITALVCHPHPLYGGTMHNKVAHRLASTLHQLGCVALRFNFRGAGKSAGTHDRGIGELEDARAALRWLEARYPDSRRWIAGFSFGAWVAARLAAAEAAAERVILVAPSVRSSDYSAMHTSKIPKLVLQGTADEICPPDALDAEFPSWAEPKRLVHVAAAGHFFDRQLGALGQALERELAPLVTEAP